MIKIQYSLEDGIEVEAATNTKEVLGFIVHLIEQEKAEPTGVIASVLKSIAIYHASMLAFHDLENNEIVPESVRDLMIARINAEKKGVTPDEKPKNAASWN